MTLLPLQTPPSSLCILRLSALGDACHTVALTQAIQAVWPETAITWIIGKFEAKLIGDLPGVNFLIYDKAKDNRAELRRSMANKHFDVLLHIHASMRANRIARDVPARIKLGYDKQRARDLQWLFTNERIPAKTGQHVVDAIFEFARSAGAENRKPSWEIPVSDEDRAFATQNIPNDQRTLIISPCSSHALRNWHAAGYAAVADHAIEKHGFKVVICGGPSPLERDMGDQILKHMKHEALDLISKDTLKQLLAMLERATLLLTPDSGPMHMATAVGTPVIGLHAASNPKRSGPYNSIQWCVDRYDDAAQKFLKKPAASLRWGTKIERNGVMDLIAVDDVTERLDAFCAAAQL